MNRQAVFIVWKAYQRRVDAFKERLGVLPIYIHFAWEERSLVHKAVSYIGKFYQTLRVLFQKKPTVVYVQAPPTFAVYATWVYSQLSGAKYVVDAHNTMLYDSFWCKLPLAKYVLRKSDTVIVHNTYVAERAQKQRIAHTILMDRPPDINSRQYPFPQAIIGNRKRPRVVVPCSYGADEPLEEMQKATLMLPDVNFFITWYREKLPPQYVRGFRENVVLTGFLPLREFNALLASADAVLVLTTRIGTQPSGATEALAFQKPLVVSDLQIVRKLFPVGAVYVENNAASIAEGIREALQRRRQLAAEMVWFKEEKMQIWEKQFQMLMTKVAMTTRRSESGSHVGRIFIGDHPMNPSAGSPQAAPNLDSLSRKDLPRVLILGSLLTPLDLTGTVHLILEMVREGAAGYVCVANTHTTTLAVRDVRFREVLNRATAVVADGMPVVWCMLAAGYLQAGRVYGADLVEAACAVGIGKGIRHGFLGGLPGVAQAMVTNLRVRHPALDVAGVWDPGIVCPGEAAPPRLLEAINEAAPDILWVGLGAPKQEAWMAQHRPHLRVPVLVAVGQAFDILAGRTVRPPAWMGRHGLEWLYRLAHEPSRLWKRYLLSNSLFLWYLFRERLGYGLPQGLVTPDISSSSSTPRRPSMD